MEQIKDEAVVVEEETTQEELEDNNTNDGTTDSTGDADGESGSSLNDKLAELGLTRAEYFQAKGKKDSQESVREESSEVKEVTSNDALLGRLEARGIMDVADQQFVLSAAKNMGVTAIDALNDPFVAGKLESNSKLRKQQAATTDSKAGAGGTNEKDSTEYWLKRPQDELPPKGQTALRREVIKARTAQAKKQNMFG